jgi:hypothetical protein
MALYSNENLLTDITEPVVHNGDDRTEFMITGSVLPNLKLVNLGQFGDNTKRVPDSVGNLAHISRIALMNGRDVLTEIRNFNELMAFEMLLKPNKVNHQIGRNLYNHKVGYKSFYHVNDAVYQEQTNIKDNKSADLTADDTVGNTNRATLHLNQVLNMLNVVPVLSDKVFKNGIRLVIEYENDLTKRVSVDNATSAVKATRPLLVVDRIQNEKIEGQLIGSLSNTSWTELEMDRVFIDENTAGTQETDVKVNGFNSKRLERVRISKKFQDNTKNFDGNNSVGYGPYQSIVPLREAYNIRINGRNIMPRSDIAGNNRILAALSDTWGPLNLHEDSVNRTNFNLPKMDGSKGGQQGYLGLYVGEKVNDLKLNYKRDFQNDTNVRSPYNNALRLEVVGEVVKELQLSNGSYLISYA